MKKNKKRAFILLFSLLISSVILAAGLSVTRIMLRQITLTSVQRDSQIAFFAADAGIECARYLLENPVTAPNNATCNGEILKAVVSSGSRSFVRSLNTNGDNFSFNVGGGTYVGIVSPKSCVKITYCATRDILGGDCSEADAAGGKIVARGYNTECNPATGEPYEGRLVERKLAFVFSI